MIDGVVQVAVDGAGKKVDNTEYTRADGTVVERQRTVIGDAEGSEASTGGLARVAGETGRGKLNVENDSLVYLESIDNSLKEILDILRIVVST